MRVQQILILAAVALTAVHAVGSDNLQWKKPNTAGQSAVITAEAVAATSDPAPVIQQVDFPAPARPLTAPLATPKSTQAELDYRYPELRPQSKTPPAGATYRYDAPQYNAPLPPKDASSAAQSVDCGGKITLKAITEISCDIRPLPGELPDECLLDSLPYHGRNFNRTCFQWTASAVCTKAAYFEDVQLERYGHSICPFLQPVISGAKFFLTVPMLPYKMGITPPNECVYTLGHYRAGSCSPYMIDPFPISVRAVLFEAAAVGGVIAAIP